MADRSGARSFGSVTTPRPTPAAQTDVLVAGGGTAALELLLALRDRTTGTPHVTLLTPDAFYRSRPLASYGGLVPHHEATLSLDRFTAELGVGHVDDRLASVDAQARTVTTAAGGRIGYRALVVAVGGRPRSTVPGTVVLGTLAGEARMRELTAAVRERRISRVAVVVPGGVHWTLPAYECALLLRHLGETVGQPLEIVVLTAEARPMSTFGDAISATLVSLLRRRGVELRTAVQPQAFTDGRLWIPLEGTLPVDAAVALPLIGGPAISGLPSDGEGFLAVDDRGRVVDLDRPDELAPPGVWAIGDAADHPVKQGGLAVAQAEVAAADLVGELGIGDPTPPPDEGRVLRAALLDGPGTLYLRAEHGPEGWRSVASREPLWWPPAKVAGGRVEQLLAGPAGVPVRA